MCKLTIIAPLSALALAACGSTEPAADNLDAPNLALNAMVANEVAVANDVADAPQAQVEAPVAPPPAPAPKATPKAAPKPSAQPKAVAPKPPEPNPEPAPTCEPEHRAAGHC